MDVVFRGRNNRRTLSLSSLRIFQEQATNRNLVSVAEGEVDKTVQFMAPVHTDVDLLCDDDIHNPYRFYRVKLTRYRGFVNIQGPHPLQVPPYQTIVINDWP